MSALHIIGGGLSGLALGIALRRHNVPVHIFESGNYPRHRVCGEFICGVKDETLTTLGIGELFQDALIHQHCLWTVNGRTVLNKKLPLSAFGISRWTLDNRLKKLYLELGGELTTGHKIPSSQWHEDPEGKIYCTGKFSKAEAQSKRKTPNWIGLKCHYILADQANDLDPNGLEMHTAVGKETAGYVGLCQVENRRVNVCGMFRTNKSLNPRGKDTLETYLRGCGLNKVLKQLHSWQRDDASFSAIAGFTLGSQSPPPANMMRLGDSERIIPPFTGSGMSMAFESAELAIQPLLRFHHGEINWEAACAELKQSSEKAFSQRMQQSLLMQPLLLNSYSLSTIGLLARCHLLPFDKLFTLLR